MKCGMACLAALAVLAGTQVPLSGQKGPGAGRYGWLGSLEEGKAQAKQTGKPLMVVFRCEP